MVQSQDPTLRSAPGQAQGAISIVQRGNLRTLEETLRRQWRMGQNIVLCWASDERGLLVIFVPHYFLGNFCADESGARENEEFIRALISGRRRRDREALFTVCERLGVAPTFIKLETPLGEDTDVQDAVEQLIRRYGVGYVESRAVMLFDIAEFSLYTPFEQASQLNSLSYSFNSAYNKLLSSGIEINFARTTTGDGYYVWNRALGPGANRDLFYFMLLVVADNAVARAASRGHTVPVIRSGFHIGSHYELYQAEGVNPTLFSYIVGDVTIELARLIERARPGQILVGDFHPIPGGECGTGDAAVAAADFVAECDRGLPAVLGTRLSGRSLDALHCRLSAEEEGTGKPRRLQIVDKHGLSHRAYNLEIALDLEGEQLLLGLERDRLSAGWDGPPALDESGAAAPG